MKHRANRRRIRIAGPLSLNHSLTLSPTSHSLHISPHVPFFSCARPGGLSQQRASRHSQLVDPVLHVGTRSESLRDARQNTQGWRPHGNEKGAHDSQRERGARRLSGERRVQERKRRFGGRRLKEAGTDDWMGQKCTHARTQQGEGVDRTDPATALSRAAGLGGRDLEIEPNRHPRESIRSIPAGVPSSSGPVPVSGSHFRAVCRQLLPGISVCRVATVALFHGCGLQGFKV